MRPDDAALAAAMDHHVAQAEQQAALLREDACGWARAARRFSLGSAQRAQARALSRDLHAVARDWSLKAAHRRELARRLRGQPVCPSTLPLQEATHAA